MVIVAFLFAASAFAETSNSPYIDQIRREMKEAGVPASDNSENYTQAQKAKLKPEAPETDENYIHLLKTGLPPEKDSENFTAKEKEKLEPKETGGAIAAVKEGRSELKVKKPGQIHGAFGLKMAATESRTLQANAATQANTYQAMYGDSWTPDFGIYYEYRPFHNVWLGSLGIVGNLGASFKKAQGLFAINLPKPGGFGAFGSRAQTKFTFINVPVSVGPIYHLNLLRYLQPYAEIAPAAIGYFESRDDNRDGHRGYSTGVYTALGVGIPLDFIDPKSGWNLYQEYGVKHYYLQIEYSRLSTLSGDVHFTISGLSAGLGYEF